MRVLLSVILVACLSAGAFAADRDSYSASPREIKALLARQAAQLEALQLAQAQQQEESAEEKTSPVKGGQTAADMFENRDPMFPKNSAATTYAKETAYGDEIRLGAFNETVGVPEKKEVKPARPAMLRNGEKQYASEEDRIKDVYGDPLTEPKVKAVDNAPAPFKAMMDSLQTGNEELAFDYARQYVRYMKKLKTNVNEAGKLTNMALEREGLRQPTSPEDPAFDDQYRRLMEKDLQKVRGQSEDGMFVSQLNPEVKLLLDRAEQAENGQDEVPDDIFAVAKKREREFPAGLDPSFDEARERAKVRASIAGRVPVDPNGKVKVLLFALPNEQKSMIMARQLEELTKKRQPDRSVQVEMILGQEANPYEIQALLSSQGLSMPTRSDLQLAARVGVIRYPTLVFVAPSIGKYVLEEGFRPPYYIDEVTRAVQGFSAKAKE